MISVDKAVRHVIGVGAPVLLLDTCALLDLMRDPAREKFSADHVCAAHNLLARAEARPPGLSILLAQQVEVELLSHIDEIERETERAIQRFESGITRTFGVMNAIGVAPALPLPALSPLGFPARARAVVQRFVTAAHVVAEQDVHVMRGWDRVRKSVAPATRAKQSVKDCIVIETYFDIARALRTAGFDGAVLFFTTNTADYADGARPRLHSQLEPDFAARTMSFETGFLAVQYAI